MTVKERLREVVEAMTEDQAADALRAIDAQRAARAQAFFDDAPNDDEPVTDDDERAIAEGRADLAAGRTVPLSELLDELRDDDAA